MGELIEVDFVRGEILHGVEEMDTEVAALWAEYHRAVENGGVDFPLVEEGFDALHRAVFG